MNPFDLIQGFLERAEGHLPSPERLAAEFLKSIEPLGFRNFACCSHVDPFHPPREAVMLHNYPQGWVRTFSDARLYEIDPVLERAQSHLLPFFWDTALRPESLTGPQRTLLADAAGYGLTHGYTIPLHLSWLPGTLRASCSVIPDGERVDSESYVVVEVLAIYLYLFASRIQAPWLTPARVLLTQRERGCLALVAQGKEDWSIGRLMGLGTSTAHYHIEHLKRRLGVSTRPQAVAQALMTGQLTFAELARRIGAEVTDAGIDPAPPDLHR
ncbi:MAG: LuxR family transcriptional regulator [Proteobacteria bacterium]|nr:LuxR family transcriptional regulator [Pseudomonadota bacterium]